MGFEINSGSGHIQRQVKSGIMKSQSSEADITPTQSPRAYYQWSRVINWRSHYDITTNDITTHISWRTKLSCFSDEATPGIYEGMLVDICFDFINTIKIVCTPLPSTSLRHTCMSGSNRSVYVKFQVTEFVLDEHDCFRRRVITDGVPEALYSGNWLLRFSYLFKLRKCG